MEKLSGEGPEWPAFRQRVAIILMVVVLALAAWKLADLLLLLFAGTLFAVVLDSASRLLARRTGLSSRWSLTLVTIVLGLLLVGAVWGFGTKVSDQISQLAQAVPSSFDKLKEKLSGYPQLQQQLDQLRHTNFSRMASGMLPPAFEALSTVFGILIDVGLALFFGLYIAAEPAVYRWGLLSLVPPRHRSRAREVLDETHKELLRWVTGQLVAMLIVAVMASIGLGLSGVAAWPALAALTGLLEFVPIVGPLSAAIPSLLIAVAGGTAQLLWVAGTYLVIHEFESNILVPLVQRRAASLPPLLAVSAMAGGAILFGVIGLVLATPLAVTIMVVVRMLYVEDTLGGPAVD